MIVQAVIFDADGTLIDSEVPGMDVMYERACEAGLALTRDRAHDYFRGRRMSEIVAWIASQLPEVLWTSRAISLPVANSKPSDSGKVWRRCLGLASFLAN